MLVPLLQILCTIITLTLFVISGRNGYKRKKNANKGAKGTGIKVTNSTSSKCVCQNWGSVECKYIYCTILSIDFPWNEETHVSFLCRTLSFLNHPSVFLHFSRTKLRKNRRATVPMKKLSVAQAMRVVCWWWYIRKEIFFFSLQIFQISTYIFHTLYHNKLTSVSLSWFFLINSLLRRIGPITICLNYIWSE